MAGFVQTATCAECGGTSEVAHPSAGESHKCFRCNGWGVVKRTSEYQGYKTAATAAAALKRGHGTRCRECSGTGTGTYPLTTHCYQCRDGRVVTRIMPGDSWGDLPSALRYEHGSGAVARAYADAVTVHVVAQNRESTWNEAHLGHGMIVSVVDYGDQWRALIAGRDAGTLTEAIESVREVGRTRLREGFQWIKVTRDDGVVVPVVVMVVTRGGYSLRGMNVPAGGMLPPTYTPAVLDAPVG